MRRKISSTSCCIAVPEAADAKNVSEMAPLRTNTISNYLRMAWIGSDLSKDSLLDVVRSGDALKCNYILASSVESENDRNIKKNLILHEAVKQGNISVLEELLSYANEYNPNLLFLKNEGGNTALHFAVEQKKFNCCKSIMRSNPETIYKKNKSGDNSLHLMVSNNYLLLCEEAMTDLKPDDLNAKNNKHHTLVHIAARENSDTILKLLLEKGVNSRVYTKQKYTPLHYAAENGSAKCVSLLLAYLSADDRATYIDDQTKDGSTALILAAKKGFSDCARSLQKANVNLVDNTEHSALHFAAKKGSLSTVQFLIENGADVNLKTKENQTALVLATSACNELCLAFLLDKTGHVETPQILLKVAVNKNQIGCLRVLLSRQAIKHHINVQFSDDDNNTLLHMSFKKSYYKITHELLVNGARRDLMNGRLEYPLHLAAAQKPLESRSAEEDRMEDCKIMLRQSHDFVNAVNCDQQTPLHLAAKSGNLEMIRSLLKKESKALAEDSEGRTAIHLAAISGNDAALKMLLKNLHNSHLNELGSKLHHPLHLAAEGGHKACCEIIIKYLKLEAKLGIPNKENKFPVDVAYDNKHMDVFRYLLSAMTFQQSLLEFGCRVHGYFKESIKTKNIDVMESIIESDWYCVCFDNQYCAGLRVAFVSDCSSFRDLVNCSPKTATKALDRHITHHNKEEVHSFSPFEYIYYNKNEDDITSSFESGPEGKLQTSVTEFEEVRWGRDHPLMKASEAGYVEILSHKLTKSWLDHKYATYGKWLLGVYVAFEIIATIVAAVMFSGLSNDNHLMTAYNGTTRLDIVSVYRSGYTDSPVYQEVLQLSADDTDCSRFGAPQQEHQETIVDGSAVWNRTVCAITHLQTNSSSVTALQVGAIFLIVLQLAMEAYFWLMTRRPFRQVISLSRILRIAFFLVVLIPMTSADFMLGLKPVVVWQFGVIAVLFAVLNVASTLNNIPNFNVFMPLSTTFVLGYMRVISLIVIIILAFALSFHFLLINQPPFVTMPYSIIKTLVWMLGDLGYDDIFLNEDIPINYPIQANILFVLFVTTIGGLVFNLILKNPTDQLEDIRLKAAFYEADLYLKLHLIIDDCLPFMRRKYAICTKIVRNEPRHSIFYSKLRSLKLKETQHEDNYNLQQNEIEVIKEGCQDHIALLKMLIEKVDNQKETISELTRKFTKFEENSRVS